MELAILKLNQNDIAEYDRIYLQAKHINVKSAITHFSEDERIFEGLLRFVQVKTSALVQAHKDMHKIIGEVPLKFSVELMGNEAITTMEKAEEFKIHNPQLFNAVYYELLMVMSRFDLVWNKHDLRVKAKRCRALDTKSIIQNDEITVGGGARVEAILDRAGEYNSQMGQSESGAWLLAILSFLGAGFIFLVMFL